MFSETEQGQVEFLENHLRENPDSILFARLADYYLQLNRIDAAISLCEDGIKRHPYYPTGHFVLGKSYLANGMHEQAEKEFKRVLLFDPKFLAAHKLYGDLMKEIGWEKTCETSYRKILQIDPLEPVARDMVGDMVLEGDELQEEMEEFIPQAPEQKTEPPKPPPEFDFDAISPAQVEPKEEDILFDEPEFEEQPPSTPQQDVPQLDDKKAEEFSYILDDIFKDEVVEDQPPTSQGADFTTEIKEEKPDKVEEDLSALSDDFDTSSKTDESLKSSSTSAPDRDVAGTQKEDAAISEQNGDTASAHPPPRPPKPLTKSSRVTSPFKGAKRKGDKIVTPTLGEIYSAQGQYSKAIDVFETLIKKHPDNEFYIKKIETLKQKLEESKNASKD